MIKSRLFATVLCVPIRQFAKMESRTVQSGFPLKYVIDKLENYAPLSFAEKWDNVGLLIEPFEKRNINTVFLTNDLTLKVMEEAVSKKADLIISYHPPIFTPLKRITQNNWKEKIVSMCLAKNIALYSPHTSWDAAPYGESINYWLSNAFLPTSEKAPIIMDPDTKTGPGLIWKYPSSSSYKLQQVIEDIQKYIGLPVHVAMGVDHSLDSPINTLACCAGSGASLLAKVGKIDVYLTGEMSHHELLDAQHRNITVILCNHSNTERGFLKHFQPKLKEMLLGKCEVFVSEVDKDPLETHVFKK